MAFKNVNDLMRSCMQTIQQGLYNEVADEIKKNMFYYILTRVYNEYSPKWYERRKEAFGLLDYEHNIHVEKPAWITQIQVYNIAMMDRAKTQDDYLAPMIEEGYGSKKEDYNKPRPFIKPTYEELVGEKYHLDILQKYLKSKGIKSEY